MSEQTRQTLNLPDPVPKPPHMPAAREVKTAPGHLSHALACPPSLLVLNPPSSVFHVPNVAEQTCWREKKKKTGKIFRVTREGVTNGKLKFFTLKENYPQWKNCKKV